SSRSEPTDLYIWIMNPMQKIFLLIHLIDASKNNFGCRIESFQIRKSQVVYDLGPENNGKHVHFLFEPNGNRFVITNMSGRNTHNHIHKFELVLVLPFSNQTVCLHFVASTP